MLSTPVNVPGQRLARLCIAALAAVLLALTAPATLQASQKLTDIAYGPGPKQTLDVYLPAAPRNAPIMIHVHGGGFKRGDKANRVEWQSKVAYWQPAGYIFVSINYGLYPGTDPIEQAEHVAQAVAYVQQQAPGWGGDPDKVVLIGHSAGGFHAGLVAASKPLQDRFGVRPLRGALLLEPPFLDPEHLMTSRAAHAYEFVFGTDPAGWPAASPLAMMSQQSAPMMVLCTFNRPLCEADAQRMATKAQSLGTELDLWLFELGHVELSARLGDPGGLRETVDQWLHEIGLP